MTQPIPAAADRPLSPVPGGGVAVVVTGGGGFDQALLAQLPPERTVIAADSGLETAVANGLEVDLVIGDLDSVSPDALARAGSDGVAVERHPVDKDDTDLDLALQRVAAAGFTECIVLGGGGGRLSHLLGNAQIIAAPRHDGIDIRWLVGSARVMVARPGRPVTVEGLPGDLVSLLPAGGSAGGVATTGLRWVLSGDLLEHGSSRGISNVLTGVEATVSLASGTVLVVHEGRRS